MKRKRLHTDLYMKRKRLHTKLWFNTTSSMVHLPFDNVWFDNER